MDKEKIVKYLRDLNQIKTIKVQGTDKERVVFIKSDEVFKIYGGEKKEVLTPFNDYTYDWLNTFISNVADLIEHNNYEDYDELQEAIQEQISEWADSQVDIYTYDLTAWLHDNNGNIWYLDEVVKEYGKVDNIIMKAQYMAIEELFNNALPLLIADLKEEFEDD